MLVHLTTAARVARIVYTLASALFGLFAVLSGRRHRYPRLRLV